MQVTIIIIITIIITTTIIIIIISSCHHICFKVTRKAKSPLNWPPMKQQSE